jgi:hypothetical protein
MHLLGDSLQVDLTTAKFCKWHVFIYCFIVVVSVLMEKKGEAQTTWGEGYGWPKEAGKRLFGALGKISKWTLFMLFSHWFSYTPNTFLPFTDFSCLFPSEAQCPLPPWSTAMCLSPQLPLTTSIWTDIFPKLSNYLFLVSVSL